MERLLSPKELARAIGVSESSLKRWADDGVIPVTRTAGGHRRILLRDALSYIRQTGAVVVQPEVLGLPAEALRRPGAEDERDQFIEHAVLAADLEALRGALLARYVEGEPLGVVFDGPLAAALREIGEAWKQGPGGIHAEHRATDACIHGLNFLRSLLPARAADAPLAMGGAPEGDPYQVPTLMAATVLAAEGWREINLGPNLPIGAFCAAMREYGPRLVWLSLTSQEAAKTVMRELPLLEKTAEEIGAAIAVGGQAMTPAVVAGRKVHALESMQAMAGFARGLQASGAKLETVT